MRRPEPEDEAEQTTVEKDDHTAKLGRSDFDNFDDSGPARERSPNDVRIMPTDDNLDQWEQEDDSDDESPYPSKSGSSDSEDGGALLETQSSSDSDYVDSEVNLSESEAEADSEPEFEPAMQAEVAHEGADDEKGGGWADQENVRGWKDKTLPEGDEAEREDAEDHIESIKVTAQALLMVDNEMKSGRKHDKSYNSKVRNSVYKWILRISGLSQKRHRLRERPSKEDRRGGVPNPWRRFRKLYKRINDHFNLTDEEWTTFNQTALWSCISLKWQISLSPRSFKHA